VVESGGWQGESDNRSEVGGGRDGRHIGCSDLELLFVWSRGRCCPLTAPSAGSCLPWSYFLNGFINTRTPVCDFEWF
jgi:hypothetical protein